jgi:hypothetical protein
MTPRNINKNVPSDPNNIKSNNMTTSPRENYYTRTGIKIKKEDLMKNPLPS